MAITASSVADLITSTLKALNRDKLTVNVTDLQRFFVLPMIEKNHMIQEQSGTHIQLNYMYRNAGSFANNGMYYTQSGGVIDMLTTGNIPWCFSNNHCDWEVREVAMNRSPARIVDLVKTRRLGMEYSTYEGFETNFWGKPADSTDTTTPWGVDMFIVGATGTPSFQGGAPSGWTTYANINSTTYPRWQNWAGVYTSITKADLVRKIREAMYKTDFMVPPKLNQAGITMGRDNTEMFTTYTVVQTLEEIAEGQNDNLGNDLASKDGMVKIRRAAIHAVPKLDATTSTNPVYGINWSTVGLAKLSGQFGVESPAEKVPNQPTTVRTNVDYAYNFACTDRRRNFKLNQ